MPSTPGAEAMHGISFDQVRGKRLKDRVVRGILRKADFLIAHNAAFDRRFVEALYPETQRIRWYCSMNGIRWKKKGFAFEGIAATDGPSRHRNGAGAQSDG